MNVSLYYQASYSSWAGGGMAAGFGKKNKNIEIATGYLSKTESAFENGVSYQSNREGVSGSGFILQSNRGRAAGNAVGSFVADSIERAGAEQESRIRQLKDMVRGLKQVQSRSQNSFGKNCMEDKQQGMMEILCQTEKKNDKDDDKDKKPVHYNFKEVSSKIQRAKTSVSASQAVLSAKRKVMEVKRQISSGDGDSEELQFALTHAKRMEMVAKRKKHHLEMEELVEKTGKRDERLEKQKDVSSEIKSMMISQEEEKVNKREDEIFATRESMIGEGVKSASEAENGISEEELIEMNKMISELGEKEMEQLEETLQMFENMEIANPHMSEEELKKMKQKHRDSENKAIIKADMEYLKSMIKHQMDKMGRIQGMNIKSATVSGNGFYSSGAISQGGAFASGAPGTMFSGAGALGGVSALGGAMSGGESYVDVGV